MKRKKKFNFSKIKVESKVLQYYGNMRHNLAVLDAFVEVVKVTNHIRL